MGDVRRGVASASALAIGAAPAMAGKGNSDTSVRRQAELAPVAVPAVVSEAVDSSAVLRLFKAAALPALRPRREGPKDAGPLGEHMEVPRT